MLPDTPEDALPDINVTCPEVPEDPDVRRKLPELPSNALPVSIFM
jgi:hypothetical protein